MYKISIDPDEIEKMPLGSFPGEIHVIEKGGLEFTLAMAYLKRQKIIGFDTETKPVFEPGRHQNHVALLQLSGARKAFLFRINKMGMRSPLCKLLADPKVIKVGAAVHDDIRGLQYHGRFTPAGFVDLQKIVWEYGIKDKSVKKMAAIILGLKISKTQQLSNWEAAVLNDAQKLYAATDAWVCREMLASLQNEPKNPLTPEQMAQNPPQNSFQNSPQHSSQNSPQNSSRNSSQDSSHNDQNNIKER